MKTYSQFKNSVLGKGFNIDGSFGAQCWDGYAQFCIENNVPYANCTATGYAHDIWTQRKTNGILKYFDEVTNMEPGDVAVFKVTSSTPYSHIAIFDSDAGNGYGNFLGQNQGGSPYPGGGGVFNITKLPYSATFDTAFRLKGSNKQSTVTSGGSTSMNTKRINGDLYSGVITDTDPNIMNSDNNRVKIDRIVIHHNAGTSDENARRTWYTSTGVGTSAHYQVTPTKIWGCVGEESVAYHSGNYSMNQRSIGIEHLNSTVAPTWLIAEETYKNSAKLIADICKRYNIPLDRRHIIGHREVSATACPGGINIDKLINMAKAINEPQKQVQQPIPVKSTNSNKEFKVKVSINNLNVRKDPSVKSTINGVAKPGVYTITETKNSDGYEWGKLKSGLGWIALTYITRL